MSQNNDQELDDLMSTKHQTTRATVDSLEQVLYKPHKVLDHGFIRVVDYMGDDSAIVQAARVSYGKGTKAVNKDQGLINYLMRHRHTTPFEMCDIKFHIKLPIFVARQWIRHRTASVNEYSARYSIMGKEFYLPEKQHLAPQSTTNMQGREVESLPDELAEKVLGMLKDDSLNAYDHYIQMMNEDDEGNIINEDSIGLTRELARMNLSLNYYTEWYWKINLHNLLHFVALRADPHAQYEIRAYADVMLDIVRKWVPFACNAFEEYRMHARNFSRTELENLKKMLEGRNVSHEDSGLSKREWNEFASKLELEGA